MSIVYTIENKKLIKYGFGIECRNVDSDYFHRITREYIKFCENAKLVREAFNVMEFSKFVISKNKDKLQYNIIKTTEFKYKLIFMD